MQHNRLRILVIFNIVSFILALTLNFLAVSLPLNNKTTGELSDQYANYFVPAGFTFSIWGIIYILLIAFIFYHSYKFFKNDPGTLKKIEAIGPWFIVSNIANASWIVAWHYQAVGLSVAIMFTLLYALLTIYLKQHELKTNNFADKCMILLPFSVYLGWISVATIANITAFLVSIQWNGGGISPVMWATIMIVIATILGILAIFKKQDIGFSLVIVWALWGIYSKQVASGLEETAIIVLFAKFAMTLLLIYIALTIVGRRTYFQNTENMP